jgi:hypothetical protein
VAVSKVLPDADQYERELRSKTIKLLVEALAKLNENVAKSVQEQMDFPPLIRGVMRR